MSDPGIHVFTHHAMATFFQVRIAGEEQNYASQAARVAFDLLDRLESLLSRFRENSDISAIAALAPGEKLRVAEPTFSCLETAMQMEAATAGAFSVTAAALRTQSTPPRWSLSRDDLSVRCDEGRLEFDLGAIGKGFALDRMAMELADWDCPSFLFSAGGSSVLVGAPPPGKPGWSTGLGDEGASRRFWLQHCSLSGSGVAVKGEHIIDPRSGQSARARARAWALAPTAAQSDALSTACMVLDEKEIAERLSGRTEWLAFIGQDDEWRHYGARELPPADNS
ncbi:MAG TPA: FAD:protein FMN transferase [Verrucomicrobiae bacterium]|jgi:thiamine biosynthesis lipoprotein|nr:FAD:protein FMN transferase [Verrucomicrobiae bacterium]